MFLVMEKKFRFGLHCSRVRALGFVVLGSKGLRV